VGQEWLKIIKSYMMTTMTTMMMMMSWLMWCRFD